MKSSRRATIFVGLGIIAILTVWYFLFRAGNNQSRDIEASRDQSGQRHEAKSEAVGEVDSKLFRDRAKAWQTFFSTSIDFFGRVIDEEGRPVEGAKTFYTVSTASLSGSPTEVGAITDQDGGFAVLGKRGPSIVVWVEHPAYHKTQTSQVKVTYANANETSESRTAPIPSRDNPTTFVLKKRQVAEKLIHLRDVRVRLPLNGSAVSVSLRSGIKATGVEVLTVELFSSADTLERNSFRPFPWMVTVSVPSGGLIERTDPTNFVAPDAGYLPTVTIERDPEVENERWTSVVRKDFFVQFASGLFGRVRLEVSGEKGRLIAQTFLNPIQGSRNLEFDPAKIIESE